MNSFQGVAAHSLSIEIKCIEQDRKHHNRQNHDRDGSQIENLNHTNTQQIMLVTERFDIGKEIIKGFEEGTLYEGKDVGYRDIYYQIQY